MDSFADKIIVVTGAGSGIGRALALQFATAGARVVVAADIEEAALAETARGSDRISTAVADVSRAADVRALAAMMFDTYGGVDVLCNNAGVFAGGFMWERPLSDFEWAMGVNLWGILHAIHEFVPRMIAAQRPAHIVNTISMSGLCSTPFSGPYNVSKFAALAATECLAHDLASVGAPIGVSAVVPSAVASRIATSGRNRPAALAGTTSDDATFVEQALADLTGQGLSPSEVAPMILEAIIDGTYLVPTRPSFADQVRERTAALLDRRLPPLPAFD